MSKKIFPDIKSISRATLWELIMARLFGRQVYYEDGYPMGYLWKRYIFIFYDDLEVL